MVGVVAEWLGRGLVGGLMFAGWGRDVGSGRVGVGGNCCGA